MEVKFTSKSNRLFDSVQNNYMDCICHLFTEFPSERQTKDQDGALILICLPVLRKICSQVLVLVFSCDCSPLF